MKLKHSFFGMLLIVLIAGCAARGQLITVDTAIRNYDTNASRQQTFDAALVVSQILNLNVAVLEKQSGLIRFETASLSPLQLDQYCEYPYRYPSTGKPWDTFRNWNKRSLKTGAGPVRGKVSITILITEQESSSIMNMRSNWHSYNATETTPCNSTDIFEREFVSRLESQLQI